MRLHRSDLKIKISEKCLKMVPKILLIQNGFPKNHFSASVVILYLIELNFDDFSGVLDNFEKRDKRTVTETFALDLLPVQFIF